MVTRTQPQEGFLNNRILLTGPEVKSGLETGLCCFRVSRSNQLQLNSIKIKLTSIKTKEPNIFIAR